MDENPVKVTILKELCLLDKANEITFSVAAEDD